MKVWSLLRHRNRNSHQGGLCFSTDSPHDRFGCSLARWLGLCAGGGTGLPVEADDTFNPVALISATGVVCLYLLFYLVLA